MALAITSPAFKQGDVIPSKYTRDGENVSPPLEWHDAPPETRSFVVLVEDPDAPSGSFLHWTMYNIPAGETGLPEGTAGHGPGGAREGVNGFGKPAMMARSRRGGMGRITTISGWPPSTCRSSTFQIRRRPRRFGRRRSPTSSPRRR